MGTTEFTIYRKPVPAARPRVSTRGTFYPKAHMEYKGFLKDALLLCPSSPIDDPCAVSFLFVLPPYKTSKHPVSRTDVDNLSKLPMDEMTTSKDLADNSRYWTDDSLIVSLSAFKRFARDGEEPHTKIKITSIPKDYAKFVDQQFKES